MRAKGCRKPPRFLTELSSVQIQFHFHPWPLRAPQELSHQGALPASIQMVAVDPPMKKVPVLEGRKPPSCGGKLVTPHRRHLW